MYYKINTTCMVSYLSLW